MVIFAAALAVGAAGSVGYALATGFARAAERADQPDVIVRFAPQRRSVLDERLRRLPNVQRISYRLEVSGVGLAAGGHVRGNAAVDVVEDGRRGYAIMAGHDLGSGPGEALVDRGVARAWNLRAGDEIRVGRLGTLRIAGVALAVDNVAFPLATVPRVYVTEREIQRRFGRERDPAVNLGLLWLADPNRLDVTLAAARPAVFGLRTEQLLTRRGVRQTIDQAAGIVIALLAVFGLVAAACAGAILAAAAGADVRRRAPLLGVQRALGASRRRVVAEQVLGTVFVAAPAAALGLTLGALVAAGPTLALLGFLNETAPGADLLGPLAGALVGLVAVVAAGAGWPAWRLNRRPVSTLLRSGDLIPPPTRRRTRGRPGLALLGARFATARRGRWLSSVAVLGVAGAAVLLVLAVAGLLVSLRDDPGTLGRRYALTVAGDASDLPAVRAVRGVAGADQRSTIEAADSFALTEPMRVIAYGADHVPFESPPLASGRRLRSAREVEVGTFLADTLGLRPGGQLALQPATGRELRFQVVGIVRALENDGRVVYARSAPFRRDDPGLGGPIAIRLAPGADRAQVARRLAQAGFGGRVAGAATPHDRSFLGVLAAVLRTVAMAIGLVCLAAVAQTLALTTRDRRRALAVLRAAGASRRALSAVLAGAAGALLLPALVIAVALERLVLGPAVARLAADYAVLPLGVGAGEALGVGAGAVLVGAVAVLVVTRSAGREPVAAGLERED
ncbi:MAG TPA: FtsX-like permease family protein [Solirubrobacteraceae bacterium]